ncbi:Osmotically-inducible protein Y [Methylococcales bacterium]|nr:Osmotically-inducible protein Y [Methylococcales bacterium]
MKTQDKHNLAILSDSAFVIVYLSAILGLAACQQEGSAEKAGKKIDQAVEKADKKLEETRQSLGDKAVKTGEYMDDTAITSTVKAEILSDPLLKVHQINVTTTNGVVNLSGDVDSQQSIERAVQIARSNPKVKSVENNLTAKGAR